MCSGSDRDYGRDALILEHLFKTSVFVSKYEFINKRHDHRFVALGRDRGKRVADYRSRDVGRRARDNCVDNRYTLFSCGRKKRLNFWQGSDAARSILFVTSLLDKIHYQQCGGLRI